MSKRSTKKIALDLLGRLMQAHRYIPEHIMLANGEGVFNLSYRMQESIMRIGKELGVEIVVYNDEGCQWDPDESRRAQAGDEHNKTTTATVTLGAGTSKLDMCEACSRLPFFSKRKKRVQIHRSSEES